MRRPAIAALVMAVGLTMSACVDEGSGLPLGSSTTDAASTTSGPTTTSGNGSSTTSGGGVTTTSGSSATTAPGSTTTSGPTTTEATTTTTTSTSAVQQPAARPVPLREGLASFDSFVFTFSTSTIGPTLDDSTTITALLEANSANDRRRTVIDSTISTAEDGPSSTSMEVIQIGQRICTYDGDSWTFERVTAQQREFLDLGAGLVDFVFVTDDGVLVGPETVAGIPSRHYRYSLPGLGQDSGALVVSNQIDYWVSDDGNVLVKYDANIETRTGPSTDPETEVFGIQTSAEMMSANESVPIRFPDECPAGGG